MCMVNEEQNSDRTGKTATRRRFIEGTATATLLAAVGSDTTGGVRRTAAYPWSNDHGNARSIKTNSSTLSVTDRLEDRRYVATGTRAYIVGDESGRFPAMGWHIGGEMGGVWSPPLKLLDGIWFGINDKWIGRANRFTSAYGHVTMNLPGNENLSITRTDFVPDGKRAALFGLQFTAGDKDESFTLTVDAHSELLSAYPWGWTTPSQEQFNLEDSVEFDGQRLVFREQGTPPVENADRHNWASVVGTKMEPVSHKTGDEFWDHRCQSTSVLRTMSRPSSWIQSGVMIPGWAREKVGSSSMKLKFRLIRQKQSGSALPALNPDRSLPLRNSLPC